MDWCNRVRWASRAAVWPGSHPACTRGGEKGWGQRPGRSREGRVARGGELGGRRRGARGAHEGPRGTGRGGVRGAGVLTSLRGRRPLRAARRAVRGWGPGRRPRLPSALPRRPRPAPPSSLHGPEVAPCASTGLRVVSAPYSTAPLVPGAARLALSGKGSERVLGEGRVESALGKGHKEAETGGRRGTEVGTERGKLRRPRVHPLLSCPKAGEEVGTQISRALSPAPSPLYGQWHLV